MKTDTPTVIKQTSTLTITHFDNLLTLSRTDGRIRRTKCMTATSLARHLLETDRTKLSDRLHAAKAAIKGRLAELADRRDIPEMSATRDICLHMEALRGCDWTFRGEELGQA